MLTALLLLAALQSPPALQQKAAPAASPMQLRAIPDEAVVRNQQLAPRLSPSAKNKIQTAAAALSAAAKQQPQMSEAQMQRTARTSVLAAFPGLAGSDIDAAVFMVMMQATQEEDAELRQAMDAMKQNNAKKHAKRTGQTDARDSLSDMSSTQQLKLQMAMDRRSKFLEALSNIEKKMADTSDSVVRNLK